MWEETKNNSTSTRYVWLNQDGSEASKIFTVHLPLSMCEPVVNSSGNVCWYVTKNGMPVMIELNPMYQSTSANATAAAAYTKDSVNPSTRKADDGVESVFNVSFSGMAHVQSYGDKNGVWNGATLKLGVENENKRMEQIKINMTNSTGIGGSIEYRVHRETYGWTPWVKNGQAAGTTGQGKRLEAIEIRLTGELAEKYSVRYRVHIQSYGKEQGWVYDGALAGTTGEAKRIESIEIQLVPRNINMNISYRVHRQTYGWENSWMQNSWISGTVGEAKRLEGITIELTGSKYSGDIVYSTHVQSYGWMKSVSNGDVSGTFGEAKRLEAIKINLTGEVSKHYDIYYRVHSQTFGWLGWAKNGEAAGTSGYAYRLEAIQIMFLKKGSSAPSNNYGGLVSNTTRPYISK